MKKIIILCLCALLILALQSACGEKAETDTEATGYILANYTALPESITNISRAIIDDNRIYLCCWEEEDEENAAYYAAAINIDGSGFERLPLALGNADVLIDIASDGNGGFWGLCKSPDQEENAAYALHRFDAGGRLAAETSLTELLEDTVGTLQFANDRLRLDSDKSGNLCVTVRYSRTYCFLFNQDGQFLFSLMNSGNPLTVITIASGQLAICSTSDGGWSYSILPLDMDRQDWGEQINIGTAANIFSGSGDTDYYLYDSSNFYSGTFGSGTKEELFNWANLGLASGDTHVFPLSNGNFAVVAGTYSQTQLLSYEFCIVEPGEDERTVLTMLSLQPDSSLREAIALFNKSNSEYRVELTSYFSMNEDVSSADWANAITKLHTELVSGKVPDLMDLANLPADAYLRRGLIEDLYPYLESDPEIDIEDYFENVFTALSIESKLPYLTSSVHVYTLLADADVVGTAQGWTVEEFAARKENGDIIVDGNTPAWFLRMIAGADTSFVNWETGECRFDSDDFIKLLELCKGMGAIRIDSEQTNCLYASLGSVLFTAQYNAQLGGNANPIGFPSSSGEVMHILEPVNKIGFSSACKYKDGAWAFVRSFLEPTLQESGSRFPYLKRSFEKIAAETAKGNTIWSGVYFGEIRETDIELAREILSTANYCNNSDEDLTDIIVEQAQDFFLDKKTAEETAAAIQSRARLYVNERQ